MRVMMMMMMSSHHQQHYKATMETDSLPGTEAPASGSSSTADRGTHTLFTLHPGPFGRDERIERNQQNQRRFTEAGVSSVQFVDHSQASQRGQKPASGSCYSIPEPEPVGCFS